MITYYTEKDLVSFGSYMVSKERWDRINEAWEKDEKAFPGKNCTLAERLMEVYHADVENWKQKRPDEEIREAIPRSPLDKFQIF